MMHMPTFHDGSWTGLGSIAVLVQADTKSWNDTTLFTLLNRPVDGKRIVGHYRASGQGPVHGVADTGGLGTYGYPQTGSGVPLTVADYLPSASHWANPIDH